MNKAEKEQFITAMMGTLEKSVLSKIDAMPENWDGVEIRAYISDVCARCTDVNRYMTRSKKRSYKNDLLVNPL